ncbi:MAG: hypothetical protein NE330_22085 [Lentisphaeraceae bacterium]|nr:hypothetical protein [Lentisphaeraceae bacterium]
MKSMACCIQAFIMSFRYKKFEFFFQFALYSRRVFVGNLKEANKVDEKIKELKTHFSSRMPIVIKKMTKVVLISPTELQGTWINSENTGGINIKGQLLFGGFIREGQLIQGGQHGKWRVEGKVLIFDFGHFSRGITKYILSRRKGELVLFDEAGVPQLVKQ